MHSNINGNIDNRCIPGILSILIGVININCADAIDRLEVAKVVGPVVHFNDAPCNITYPLKSKKALLICGDTVALQASNIADEAAILRVFTLQDDSVMAVSEFPLDKESVVIGRDRLQSIVLIDTGADLCYGTIVLGIAQSNFYNWGTLDEVIDESGEIHCSSKKITLSISKEGVDIAVTAPFLMPRKDGSYVVINHDRAYAFIKNGGFRKKSQPITQ